MTKVINVPPGWLNITKPIGLTSFQVVREIRKLFRIRQVGHGGTLDPLASGILPVALGEATKTVPYMMDTQKEYIFEVTWGEQTTTDDREGIPCQTSTNRPTKEQIESTLKAFRGEILQVPPKYAALKHAGQRLYTLAKKGIDVEIHPRHVTIHALECLAVISPHEARFRVKCGKGTYVRSLARDLGITLGCYGHISVLQRTQVGKFTGKNTILLDDLLKIGHKVFETKSFCSIVEALDDIPALLLDWTEVKRVRQGQRIFKPDLDETFHEGLYLSISPDQQAVGFVEIQGKLLKPKRIFTEEERRI